MAHWFWHLAKRRKLGFVTVKNGIISEKPILDENSLV